MTNGVDTSKLANFYKHKSRLISHQKNKTATTPNDFSKDKEDNVAILSRYHKQSIMTP